MTRFVGEHQDQTLRTAPLIRRVNLGRVLVAIVGTDGELSGSDLIAATGLTRATVLAVCTDLIRLGWVREGEARREDGTQSGRPSRWFAFNDRAGYLLGIDIGANTSTILVSDLRGAPLHTRKISTRDTSPPAEQGAALNRMIRQAFHSIDIELGDIVAVGVGLATRLDRDGNPNSTDDVWRRFYAARRAALNDLTDARILTDNDANLAALGERWRGCARDVDNLAVLLAGERFGVGLIESARLVHGGGGAGEMRYLEMLAGVGSADGVGSLARRWAAQALHRGRRTALRDLAGGSAEAVTAEMVFVAAERNDRVAKSIIDRLSTRLARIIASLASMFDPELVVIGGAVSGSAGALIPAVQDQLPALVNNPPRVAISELGNGVVATGATRLALDYVQENALSLELRRRSTLEEQGARRIDPALARPSGAEGFNHSKPHGP